MLEGISKQISKAKFSIKKVVGTIVEKFIVKKDKST
jgi:hypothetical protein